MECFSFATSKHKRWTDCRHNIDYPARNIHQLYLKHSLQHSFTSEPRFETYSHFRMHFVKVSMVVLAALTSNILAMPVLDSELTT